MGKLGDQMMKGGGTGKERVGEQKLLNREKLVSAFGKKSKSKKKTFRRKKPKRK